MENAYTCPMHPNVRQDVPGTCPKCGMELVSHGEHGGQHEHEDHAGHHEMMARDFKKRFFLALPLVLAVLLLSPSVQDWAGFKLDVPGQEFALFGLASVIALWNALPFYRGALNDELRTGHWGMMTLVSLAVLTGYLYSGATTFLIEAPDFYWEISTLVLVLLFGHWMEMRAVIGASGALRELAKLIPPTARKIQEDGSFKEVETALLKKGDAVLVRAGDKVPIDAAVLEGSSSVNESLLTGESKPVPKSPGDEVIGGSVNGEGALKVRVTKTGAATALSQIISLVRRTQESKPKTQRLADRAAHWLTIAAIAAGLLTFIAWNFVFAQGLVFALTLAITVVVIACPHALGLAIPTVTTITSSLAAKNGILIRDMEGLETARNVSYAVFDKTGTLTTGEFGVTDIAAVSDWSQEKILQAAASLDQNSSHAIAQSVVKEARERKVHLLRTDAYENVPGKGSRGVLAGMEVLAGNASLLKERGIDAEALASPEGKTLVYVAAGKEVKGVISLADAVREESRAAVEQLHKAGIKVAMLTGDNEQTAAAVARELGIDTYFARVLPEDKIGKVKELQEQGNVVMMVGDGVNDAPALIQADVGVAIGAGTDVAVESAEIVLVKNNPADVSRLIRLSRATMAKMAQNLFWAAGYNVVAIPVAAGVLYSFGVLLRPEWGALLMSASSVIVVVNALLLKRLNLA